MWRKNEKNKVVLHYLYPLKLSSSLPTFPLKFLKDMVDPRPSSTVNE